MQCLFCSKLLFNPVQINGEFLKNTVMTNLSTLDRNEQRSELRRPGTMSMRCTQKKNGVKEYKFTFHQYHHRIVAGSLMQFSGETITALQQHPTLSKALCHAANNRIESSNHLVCKINCGSSITSFVVQCCARCDEVRYICYVYTDLVEREKSVIRVVDKNRLKE